MKYFIMKYQSPSKLPVKPDILTSTMDHLGMNHHQFQPKKSGENDTQARGMDPMQRHVLETW